MFRPAESHQARFGLGYSGIGLPILVSIFGYGTLRAFATIHLCPQLLNAAANGLGQIVAPVREKGVLSIGGAQSEPKFFGFAFLFALLQSCSARGEVMESGPMTLPELKEAASKCGHKRIQRTDGGSPVALESWQVTGLVCQATRTCPRVLSITLKETRCESAKRWNRKLTGTYSAGDALPAHSGAASADYDATHSRGDEEERTVVKRPRLRNSMD